MKVLDVILNHQMCLFADLRWLMPSFHQWPELVGTRKLKIKCSCAMSQHVWQCLSPTGVLTDTSQCAGTSSGEVWSMKVLLWWRKRAKKNLRLGFGLGFSVGWGFPPLSVFLYLVLILEMQSLNDKKKGIHHLRNFTDFNPQVFHTTILYFYINTWMSNSTKVIQ